MILLFSADNSAGSMRDAEGRKKEANNKDDLQLHVHTWPGLQFLGRFEVVSGGVRGREEGGSGGCPGAHRVALAPPTAATHDRPRPQPRLGGRGLLRGERRTD